MQAFLTDPQLQAQFIASYGLDGKPLWNTIAFCKWLDSYAQCYGLLLLHAEVLGGSPVHGPKLTAMTYMNIPTSTHRNFVAFGKYIAMLVTYHKGNSITGIEKLIPHPLDAVTSDLVVQDLAITCPFAQQAALICYLKQPKICSLYSNHLFLNNGHLFDTTDISNLMDLFTAETLHTTLGIQGWRQVSMAFRCKMYPALNDLMGNDSRETGMFLECFGLFKPVLEVNIVAAMDRHIEELVYAEMLFGLDLQMKAKFKDLFEPITHVKDLPNDVIAEICLQDANQTIKR
ncbi:hypothetical protein J132_08086 [Termitomyces sp. J132]|nr:hypothetical protein J132_08086 [Termitomyces sp. J132]